MFKSWKSKYPESWFSCNPGVNGFLPVNSPLERLPEKYNIINRLLEEMKITQFDSNNDGGLLNQNKFADTIDKELPLYDLSEEEDIELLSGLFRDYCFMSSAYSLETSHYFLKDGVYGTARDTLPVSLSEPLLILSQKLKVLPWLDYAYGYGLNNAKLIDEGMDKGLHTSYKTIRMFNGIPSESGFINTHVAMVSYSPELLKYQQDILENVSLITNPSDNYNKIELFNNLCKSLNDHHSIFLKIISSLHQMWGACKKTEYLSFRTFIMGHTGNSGMYPDESIDFTRKDGSVEKHSYRGETGAQDSLIPSIDSLFQINYPCNKLTEYLFDLRKYRPKDHQEYIEYNKNMANELNLVETIGKDPKCSLALFKNLNLLRLFRKKHWNLTKIYIIKNTKHPVATGGTPITTWLPNQLGATIETMLKVDKFIANGQSILNDQENNEYETIRLELKEHYESLIDEVGSLQESFSKQEHESFLNR